VKCSMCSKPFPKARSDMGYTICTTCSTEEKKVGHIIYPHKTGAFVQVMDRSTQENLNRLDRRGYKRSSVGSPPYKKFSIPLNSSTPTRARQDTSDVVFIEYSKVKSMVMSYYDEWGYEKTLEYLRQLNSDGDIALMQRVKLQDIITERYLNPSPRALVRKFNKEIA